MPLLSFAVPGFRHEARNGQLKGMGAIVVFLRRNLTVHPLKNLRQRMNGNLDPLLIHGNLRAAHISFEGLETSKNCPLLWGFTGLQTPLVPSSLLPPTPVPE